jgi:lysophospholipase L1-like esterase
MKIIKNAGLHAFGDSFTVGFNASPQSLGYARLLANVIGGTFTNRGVGSSMSTTAARLSRQHLLPNRTMPVSFMAGLNDIRQGGINAIPKLEGNLRSFLSDCFLSQVIPASQMVRVGSWTALPNAYGGKAYYNGGTPLYCNSNINASLSWTFEGDNVAVGAYRTNGTTGNYRDLNISIDGGAPIVFELHANTNEIVTFDTKVISGLGEGTHTLTITPTTTLTHTTVDYVGTLSKDMPPVLVSEIPHLLNWAQYNSIATLAICEQANIAINEVFDEFAGYPIELIKVNDFYDALGVGQCSSDGIHPTNLGHSKILDAFKDKITIVEYLTIPSSATEIIVNDGTEHIFTPPLTIEVKS